MTGWGWRWRMFARRAWPHTPAKRWAYGSALLLAALLLALGWMPWALGVLALAVAVRLWDMRRARARRGQRPAERTYFFEGPDSFGEPEADRRRR